MPGLAIARALVARGHEQRSILYVGSRRGIDRRLVGPSGFPLVLLPGRGIARRLTFDNVVAGLGLLVAVVRAFALLVRHRPRVVVSLGGYAAAPCGLAAGILRIPLVLAEQNAIPTSTHRMLSRFARASAVPFEGTPLPRPVLTGNPVRDEVLAVDPGPAGRAAARAALGLPRDGAVIAAVGGSLGSRTINTAVCGLAERWRDRADVAIRHVIGERDWDEFGTCVAAPPSGGLCYQPVRYEDHMPELLAAADVVVSRAGGATVSEIAVIGRAAILVPLPIAPYDHQAGNAGALVRAGAAVMVRDHEFTTDRLEAELDAVLSVPGRAAAMGDAARTVGIRDAADRVAALVEETARR